MRFWCDKITLNFIQWFDNYYRPRNPGIEPLVWSHTTANVYLNVSIFVENSSSIRSSSGSSALISTTLKINSKDGDIKSL